MESSWNSFTFELDTGWNKLKDWTSSNFSTISEVQGNTGIALSTSLLYFEAGYNNKVPLPGFVSNFEVIFDAYFPVRAANDKVMGPLSVATPFLMLGAEVENYTPVDATLDASFNYIGTGGGWYGVGVSFYYSTVARPLMMEWRDTTTTWEQKMNWQNMVLGR